MQEQLRNIARECFAPEEAYAALKTLAQDSPGPFAQDDEISSRFIRGLGDLLVVSPPMLDSLRTHPEWISWLRSRIMRADSCNVPMPCNPALDSYREEVGSRWSTLDAVRALKRREYLEIAYLDIAGVISFETVVLRLSNLADWVIGITLQECWKKLIEQAPTKECDAPVLDGFAVIALGKLGGRELNYSSDVDLIFCRRLTDDEAELRFYTRLGERLIQALSQPGPDGFLFRVDMRLRPHGDSGPLVPTLESLINYYESWGEAWERQALIKARHVAGGSGIGKRFSEFVARFTFARQMDDSSLEEIKRVKYRSEREYAQRDNRIHLKQGPGGIRDIEFYVQYLQLISGCTRPEVRSASTLRAIESLHNAKVLLEGEVGQLSISYLFLRIAEHRLQIRSFTPQAILPTNHDEIELLARGLGFADSQGESAGARFERILICYRSRVRAILERVYLTPGYLSLTEREEELARLLSDRTPRDRIREILGQYGFQDIDKAWQNIRLLALGPAGRLLPPGERRAFLEFAFPLLEVLRDSIDPDLGLHRLEIFAAASGNRISFLRSLATGRSHLRRLVNLLALSDLAHQILSRHPEFFDSLARGVHLHEGRRSEEFYADLRERLGASPRSETPDAALRKFRQREMVRIAYRDLAGLSNSLEVSEELSALGQACVRAAWEITRHSPGQEPGELQDPLSVIAFGKLGSRQMHYSSDLDLVLLYEDPETDASAETRARIQREQDQRVETIVELLSGVTSEGTVYDLDLRLRPEGATGLLARSWRSFVDYVLRSMQPWERMALIRSRILWAGSQNEKRWADAVARAVYEYDWDEVALEELRHLKRRIENEKNNESRINLDFKYGKGGIVDLEFLVQWLQIRNGRENSAARSPCISIAVPALGFAGAISIEEQAELLSIHRFQRLVENRYQLLEEWNSREISRESPVMERLARSMGYQANSSRSAKRAFLDEWDDRAQVVRRHLESHVFA